MKLVTAIVQKHDVTKLVAAIVRDGFRATIISGSGGFLRTGNSTIVSAVEDDRVSDLLALIKANCSERVETIRPEMIGDLGDWYPPRELEVIVGGATVFVVPIVHFERIV